MEISQPAFSGVRLLIFDLDGTLIDSKRDLVLSVNATRESMGLLPLAEEVVAACVGRGVPTLIRQALGYGQDHAGQPSDEMVERGIRTFLDYYRAHMLDHTVAYPGVLEALAELNGRTLAVLTNKPVRFSRAILDGLGIAGRFVWIYGGDSFEQKKPDPIGVLRLVADTGVGRRETMMIGDTDTDILAGRRAGTWTCGVTYGFRPETLETVKPDALLDDLRELPRLLAFAKA